MNLPHKIEKAPSCLEDCPVGFKFLSSSFMALNLSESNFGVWKVFSPMKFHS